MCVSQALSPQPRSLMRTRWGRKVCFGPWFQRCEFVVGLQLHCSRPGVGHGIVVEGSGRGQPLCSGQLGSGAREKGLGRTLGEGRPWPAMSPSPTSSARSYLPGVRSAITG